MVEQESPSAGSAAVKENGGASLRAEAGKYLTFKLGMEEYGLAILKVQEIIGMMTVTAIPRMPEWVRGVINLRGKVIPVVELRIKFGMESIEDTERTCVIVVQITFQKNPVTMGIIVDEVSEVLDILGDQLEASPTFGAALDTEFILGMGKVDKKVITLLDINNVLTTGELTMVNQASRHASGKGKKPDGCPLGEEDGPGKKKSKKEPRVGPEKLEAGGPGSTEKGD